jgi:hypothetical protein
MVVVMPVTVRLAWQQACCARARLDDPMTDLSQSEAAAATIAMLARDLRRQRADLARQMHEAEASSEATAGLVDRIEELRRRATELNARVAESKK